MRNETGHQSGALVGSERTRLAGLVVGGGSKEWIAPGSSCLRALMEWRSPNARSVFSAIGHGANRREWSVNFVFASEKQPLKRLLYLHLRPSVDWRCPVQSRGVPLALGLPGGEGGGRRRSEKWKQNNELYWRQCQQSEGSSEPQPTSE